MNREANKIEIKSRDTGYEPFPVSIMNRSAYEATTFDPSLGKPARISYRLNKAGSIRIRIAHRNQPGLLIRTLQDWTHQDFGKYELQWDGRDSSGNIVDNKKMRVLFESKDRDKGLQHEGHEEAACRDLFLSIEAGSGSLDLVKVTLEIRASLSDETPGIEGEDGLEVRCYVDYKPRETEKVAKGAKGFVLKIDTTDLENGEHLISVNVDDLHDHIGSAGVKIRVEN